MDKLQLKVKAYKRQAEEAVSSTQNTAVDSACINVCIVLTNQANEVMKLF